MFVHGGLYVSVNNIKVQGILPKFVAASYLFGPQSAVQSVAALQQHVHI